MNFKKIVAVLLCLSSIASTQAMGGRFFRAAGRLVDVAPLIVAAKCSSDAHQGNIEIKKYLESIYSDSLVDPSIKKITLKDGRMVPLVEDPRDDALASAFAVASSPVIGLAPALLRTGKSFDENSTWISRWFYGKTILPKEASSMERDKKMYEFLLYHELSHVNHNDSEANLTEKIVKPFVPALTYCSSRLLKVGRLKSLGIASLLSLTSAIGSSFYQSINEKRCDLEACATSGHALVAADLFDTIDNDIKNEALKSEILIDRSIVSFCKATQLFSAQELQDKEDAIADKEKQLLLTLALCYPLLHPNAEKVITAILSRAKKMENFMRNSNVAFIIFTHHPHSRVRAQYLREHAEKLKKEGK